MPLDFDALGRELDLWAEAGRVACFWWRDDDAVAPTAALTRLLDLSATFGIEIGVAVIPAHAEPTLGDVFARRPLASVLQHGYAHKNHGRPGAPAVELGGERPLPKVFAEIGRGYERLGALFGARFERVLAAPWNRIEPPVLAGLAELGFLGASASGARAATTCGDLAIVNIHVDPINWHERRFAGTEKALSGVIGELSARRSAAADRDEPLGLLTHHLDHDAALWDFLERFFAFTRAHEAARWLAIAEAFSPNHAAAPGARAAP